MRKLRALRPYLFLALLVALVLLLYQATIVRSYECRTNIGECTAREVDIIKSNLKKSFFVVDRRKTISELKKDPRVQDVKISFKTGVTFQCEINYFDRSIMLRVFPDFEAPEATGSSIIWKRVDRFFGGDESVSAGYFKLWENGFITANDQSDLTDATMYSNSIPSKENLVDIYRQVSYIKNNIAQRNVYIQGNDILIKIDDRTILLFDIKKDPQKVFETLQQIQAVTTIETGVRLIDLRFNKPVISLNKND